MSMLEVNHLKKYFTTQKAVDDISFKVEKGTIFGLARSQRCGQNHPDPDDHRYFLSR